MKNSDYWTKRYELLKESLLSQADDYYLNLEKQYKLAAQSIEKEIAVWYQRFADNNEISLVDAKKWLTSSELKEFKWTVEDYIKYGKQNSLNTKWMTQLENASAKVHISRLESLQVQMQQHIETLYGNQLDDVDDILRSTYENGYYQTAYELQKGLNVGWSLQQLNTAQIDKVLSKPWTVDKNTFSDRIWSNKDKLVDTVQTQLTQALIRGDSPDKAIKAISEKLNVSKHQAGRLVMTESAFFSSASQKKCFEDLGVEQYEIVATLDSRTSEICREMDGKIFRMTDYEVGITAPPFHVYCRSTVAPYFEDDSDGERIARNADGETYYVPSNTTYKNWYKKYVENDPAEKAKVELLKNKQSNLKQYNAYKERLGQDVVGSFEDFEKIKSSDSWGTLQAQYRGMGYYQRAVANESAITQAVTNTAKETGMTATGLKYRIKDKDSYLRKIKSKYGVNSIDYEVKDILRYTLISEADDLTEKALSSIEKLAEKGYTTSTIKNYWLMTDEAYNGVNVILRNASGQAFEVQYHTPQSYALKQNELHTLYEQLRALDDKTSDEAIMLMNQMDELLSEAELVVPKDIEKIR